MQCTIVIVLILRRVTALDACTFSLVPFQLCVVFKTLTTLSTYMALDVRMNKSVGFQVSPVSILIVTVGAFRVAWLCVSSACLFRSLLFLNDRPHLG